VLVMSVMFQEATSTSRNSSHEKQTIIPSDVLHSLRIVL
jgi:hypothetical protein